jgi:hypothetical protein
LVFLFFCDREEKMASSSRQEAGAKGETRSPAARFFGCHFDDSEVRVVMRHVIDQYGILPSFAVSGADEGGDSLLHEAKLPRTLVLLTRAATAE